MAVDVADDYPELSRRSFVYGHPEIHRLVEVRRVTMARTVPW